MKYLGVLFFVTAIVCGCLYNVYAEVKPDESLILPSDCTMDILSIGKSNNGDWIVGYITKEGKIKAVQYGHGQVFSTEFILPESERK